jgi:hypothetical protein
MAGIDSSELVDDEAPNYFAAGESVAPTATKTVATGRAGTDANTFRERIGRNRRDILRQVSNKPWLFMFMRLLFDWRSPSAHDELRP